MAKSEWGQRRYCKQCLIPFYDMNKKPAVCPKCSEDVTVRKSTKKKNAKTKAVPPTKKKPDSKPIPETVVDEPTLPDDDKIVPVDLDDDSGVIVEETPVDDPKKE